MTVKRNQKMAKQRNNKAEPKEDRNEGITSISVQGFKSLAEETWIEVRPLTILAGANSSGKSSIMQPLLLLKQTLEASYDPGPLLLNGPNAKFTSVNQFISRSQKLPDGQTFSVGIGHEGNQTHKIAFVLTAEQTLEIGDMIISEGRRYLKLMPNQKADDLENTISKFVPKEIKIPKLPKGLQWKVYRDRCFLGIDISAQKDMGESVFAGVARSEIPSAALSTVLFMRLFSILSSSHQELHRMVHVPGFRGNPERAYKVTTSGPDFPGTFENYVATIIAHWQANNDPRLKTLSDILTDLGLTWRVSAKPVDDTQIELQVGRLPYQGNHLRKLWRKTDDVVSIADVGFGVSQVLPVLVALLIAEPSQLVYLEQPELHLHPRAQYRLARFFADTARRGVKLVVETHSSLLLRSIQTIVAQRELNPDLVKLHWFSRNDDGVTSIRSADLDDNGAFGEWPEDFGEVEIAAEGAYLDAVEVRRKQ